MLNEPRKACDSIALQTIDSTDTRLYIHIKAGHAFKVVVRGIAVFFVRGIAVFAALYCYKEKFENSY